MKELKWKLTEEDIKIGIANGINKNTICWRVYQAGWTIENAITTPTQNKKLTEEDIKIGINNGLSRSTICWRVYKSGWSVKDAITIPSRCYKHSG